MATNLLGLPILFMIHGFEELIIVPSWVRNHSIRLSTQKRPLFGHITNASILSIGILEEFLILVCISIYSMWQHNYTIYFGFFLLYLVHLFCHILFCFRWFTYVPGCLTAIFQMPICLYLLWVVYLQINQTTLILLVTSVICCIIGVINLYLIHCLMAFISKKWTL